MGAYDRSLERLKAELLPGRALFILRREGYPGSQALRGGRTPRAHLEGQARDALAAVRFAARSFGGPVDVLGISLGAKALLAAFGLDPTGSDIGRLFLASPPPPDWLERQAPLHLTPLLDPQRLNSVIQEFEPASLTR